MVLRCHFSAIAFVLLAVLHGLAVLAIVLTWPGTGIGLLLLLAVGISYCDGLKRYGRGCSAGIRQCFLGADRSLLRLQNRDIHCEPPQVLYCSEFLIALVFREREKTGVRRFLARHKLLLFPDSLDASDHSKLRRFIRFGI